MKNSPVASGSSPIKIHYFDYPIHFMNRINEVYDFSIKYRYSDRLKKKNKKNNEVYDFSMKYPYSDILLKNINFIYNRLFCCNHTCYCVGMGSVTSVSRYVTSASRYQIRLSM